MNFNVPEEIRKIADGLAAKGFQVYLVGGCVRSILLGREPKDWDLATDAKPEEIQGIFQDSVYENTFGTVGVKTGSEDERLRVVEITTFRKEGKYTDKRHPDSVSFADKIEDDLGRRDFTVNAMALNVAKFNGRSLKSKNDIIDPFGGRDDLKKKLIRAVGEPKKRFQEDALRLVRAVRFASELGFKIEIRTSAAIASDAGFLEMIAKERIRDEFIKIISSDRAMSGIKTLEDLGLLRFVIPELKEGIACGQNKHHIYSVWEHNLRALDYAAEKGYSLTVRLASLFHDIGKPRTKRGEGASSTFYNHEMVGARMTTALMDRLKFSKEITEKVVHLVRYHLFYYNVGEVSEAGVRRFLLRVGSENVDDLIKVREADRIGSGVPKAVPYKLRHLFFMIEKVKRDPVSPKMLAIKGDEIMTILSIPPGPKVGLILGVLLDEVLEDPGNNIKETLEKRARELGALSGKKLAEMASKAKNKKEEFERGAEDEMKMKHKVSGRRSFFTFI